MRAFVRGALLAAILPLAGMAAAQQVAQPSYAKGDVMAFKGDAHTLINAINHIEQMSGGKVMEIRFTDMNGMPGYHIVLAKNGQVQFLKLQQDSANLVELDDRSMPDWMLKWRQRKDVHYATTAKVPLAQAIQTAEDGWNRAPAIAAGIARSASNPDSEVQAYNVLVDENGMVRRVAVDDTTGEIIADPQALAGWP
jgi:uncharacterized membrane protein YkoI